MVSAAKLRKAQEAIQRMRPYAEKLQEILQNLSSALDVSENPYAAVREEKNVLIVAINSNRGLCGAFNNAVIKQAKAMISEHPDARVRVLSIGKKAMDAFRKTDYVPGVGYPKDAYKIYDDLNFKDSSAICDTIMDKFAAGKIDKVYLVYNSFRNAAVQELTVEQFLPIVPPGTTEKESKAQLDYIFEPNKEEIVTELIPKSLKTQFYKAILDSHAGEHGARMTAMHKATDNATELLKELKLTYNKARQAAITNEILEIVAGAEALNG